MKKLPKYLIILVVLLFSFTLSASEFNHFQLKGALKELNGTIESKHRFSAKSNSSNSSILRNQVNQKILGLDNNQSKSVIESETSPLLQTIMGMLAGNYNTIGDEQTNPLVLNHDIGGGVLNFSGFSWHKPTAAFQLYANRELAPDLFSGRWIVHDTFVVGINAQTLLTNLKEEDLIDIDQDGIGAFAGISFNRTYHYYHYADSYLNGLTSDYSKLFLSFSKFSVNNILNLAPYEILKKEDKFSFNAGGIVTSPPVWGVSGSAGVLIKTAFESELIIQALGQDDAINEDEFLRVSVDKSWDISADAHLSLQLDFFNLLKLTLLSYDLEYSYGKSHKSNLSFYNHDIDQMLNSPSHHDEFKKIIRGSKENINEWKSNIVQLEERVTQNLNSKYNILLLGKIRKKETEQVKVIKDGVEKVFYKHYSQSIKYIQNLLSRVLNIVVNKFFKFDMGVNNFAESTKKMKIEYQHSEDIGTERVGNESEFSITLTQEYFAGKTHRWIDKKLKSEAVRHIASWSNLDSSIKEKVESEDLRGPLTLESTIEIEKDGLNYFHSLTEDEAFYNFVNICRVKNKSKWLNPKRREKSLRRFQLGRSQCVKTLGKRYRDYIRNIKNIGYYDLNKMRKFLGKYFSKVKSINDLTNLFGKENVFIHGYLSAKTKDKLPFSTYFKSGQFRGLGVIDTFMRQDGTVTPVK